ncbi:MAG: hypothetical protein EOO44_11775 [Flavobacterium sp.]|nr:MAG: hypothetical protein EOO44_11775 [Flavobacterium sp.]
MKKIILFFGFVLFGLTTYCQKVDYSLYPILDSKNGYDENLNLFYNVKLVNKSKSAITQILFEFEPTWLAGDTQLMRSQRAENTVQIKRDVNIPSGKTIVYKIYPPSEKHAVGVKLVRYSDGSFRKY